MENKKATEPGQIEPLVIKTRGKRKISHVEAFSAHDFSCPKCDFVMQRIVWSETVKRIKCSNPYCGLSNIEFEQPKVWLKVKFITGSIYL
jgi:hypothetical protein